jgi:hypothetical protein
MVPIRAGEAAGVLALLALTLHPVSGVMVGPGLVHLSLVRLLAGPVVAVGEDLALAERLLTVVELGQLIQRLATGPLTPAVEAEAQTLGALQHHLVQVALVL